MATARQKTTIAGELGMFMLEQGKIFTGEEYKKLNQGPMRWATMRRVYGNWNKAMYYLQRAQPEIWAELQSMVQAQTIDLSAIEDKDELSE